MVKKTVEKFPASRKLRFRPRTKRHSLCSMMRGRRWKTWRMRQLRPAFRRLRRA